MWNQTKWIDIRRDFWLLPRTNSSKSSWVDLSKKKVKPTLVISSLRSCWVSLGTTDLGSTLSLGSTALPLKLMRIACAKWETCWENWALTLVCVDISSLMTLSWSEPSIFPLVLVLAGDTQLWKEHSLNNVVSVIFRIKSYSGFVIVDSHLRTSSLARKLDKQNFPDLNRI